MATKIDPLLVNLFESSLAKGDIRKTKIIQSAIKCIATQGIESMSFDAIGKPLSIRRSHVAYHFKDKDDIIKTAIRYVIAKGQKLTIERIIQAKSPQEKIVAIVDAAFDWMEEDPYTMSVYLLFLYYCTVYEEYRKMHEEIRETGTRRIAAVLEQDPKIADHRSKNELYELAKMIQHTGIGALLDLHTTTEFSVGFSESVRKRAKKAVLALIK